MPRQARRQIIAALVNDPPVGDRQVHDLAALTGKPLLFVLQFLKQMEAEGDVQVSQNLGGFSRVTVSPTLKRRTTAEPSARRAKTSRRVKDQQTGEWSDADTSFWDCVTFGQLAGHAAESLSKGDRSPGVRSGHAEDLGDEGGREAVHRGHR